MKITKICKTKLVENTECEIKKEYCCNRMKGVLKDGAWEVSGDGIKIPTRMTYGNYDDYIDEYFKISFCPFCGKAIETEHVKEGIELPKQASLKTVPKHWWRKR